MGLLHGWSVAAVWALALAGALSSASDAPAARSITGRVLVGHPSAVRVKLNGGQFEAIPNAAGAFTFDNLLPGSYLVTIDSIDYTFRPIRVDIAAKGRIRARYLTQGGAAVPFPLSVSPDARNQYFETRAPFNPLSMFQSPMAIMMLMTMVMAFGMPKLLATIDPDELQRAQQSASAVSQRPAASSRPTQRRHS
ncbi:ER membrane protein complex subunit 7 beta-sandwich domain-containing protein [Plasmodiophora brassicae]|uniref:ER membrane protein complex subunit 7 beta-sandwich domain-containing protein n=1 Tax=Plasmodiophora brassicae TaxID=37360 RepID=A0A0G4J6V7_PLABS|nr:hypothetical protein PBRA_003093 [Plasmodiophora brassicae]SPQ95574.1 unnamed protein product [Plasmodiophora brassicae]